MEEVNDISCFIPEGLRDTTYHIAKIFHNKYKDSIRFARSNKSKCPVWHILDKNTQEWKMTIQNGIELRKILSEEFADLIICTRQRLKKKAWDEHISSLATQLAESRGDNCWFNEWSKTIDGQRFQILSKLENKLYSAGSKSSILKEASELFYEDSIICVKD
jgi:hypothetical protein